MRRYTIDARKGYWNLKESPSAGDLVMYADHAAFVKRVRQAAERAHAEWCLGKVFNADSNKAISKAFDELLALCEVTNG